MPGSSEVLEPAWFARECGDALWEALLSVAGYLNVTEKLEYFGGPVLLLLLGTVLLVYSYTFRQRKERTGNSGSVLSFHGRCIGEKLNPVPEMPWVCLC